MQGLKRVGLYLLVKETERTGLGRFEFYHDRFDVRDFKTATLELELERVSHQNALGIAARVSIREIRKTRIL